MDSLITAAARALAAGDPLGALNRIALRNDAPALAAARHRDWRSSAISFAQKRCLRSAARAFGPKEAVARARCVVCGSRDRAGLARPGLACEDAPTPRGRHSKRMATGSTLPHAALSRGPAPAPDRAPRRGLSVRSPGSTPRPSRQRRGQPHELVVAGDRDAAPPHQGRAHSTRPGAERAARQAGIPALTAEVESASLVLNTPAARLIARGEERPLLLDEVEALAGVESAGRGRPPSCRA